MQFKNHDELKIGELPELRILPLGEVLFHEEPDIERVTKLIDRFSADGILKNPPVVARTNNNTRRILLDGANRVTALNKLGFPHVLVQEIDLDDPGLEIADWYHAVEHLSKESILLHIDKIDGLQRHQFLDNTDPSGERFLCQILFRDESSLALFAEGDVFQKIALLRQFTDLYHTLAYMDRVSYSNLDDLKHNYSCFSALVRFRDFTKSDIVALADAGARMPSGVTRVLLPKRVLNFNLHLNILKANLSIAEKNDWLQETIRHKIIEKSIRFYREPTFFFDE